MCFDYEGASPGNKLDENAYVMKAKEEYGVAMPASKFIELYRKSLNFQMRQTNSDIDGRLEINYPMVSIPIRHYVYETLMKQVL